MKTLLNYWDRKDDYSSSSEIKRTEEVESNNKIELFEKFYTLNNRLRYCNGAYYTFQNKEVEEEYYKWIKSDDYKKKSFDLYYMGGVVD